MVRKFTKRLVDIYVYQGIGLSESLEMIAKQPGNKSGEGKRISRTAEYLYQILEKGSLFSLGIKTCPYITFDDFYSSFIALSEKTGDLKQALLYLEEKYDRKNLHKMKIVEAVVYPAFVVFFAIGICIFLCNFMDGIDLKLLGKMLSGLVCVCGGILYFILRTVTDNRLYEAFLAIDFLTKAGINISRAVGCAVGIVGAESAYGKSLEKAKEKLEFGMSLQNALKLGTKFEEGFYFADKAGGKNEVFGKLADWMKVRDERKQKFCMSLLEPLFIVITGVFLLLVVMQFFLPYLTEMNVI